MQNRQAAKQPNVEETKPSFIYQSFNQQSNPDNSGIKWGSPDSWNSHFPNRGASSFNGKMLYAGFQNQNPSFQWNNNGHLQPNQQYATDNSWGNVNAWNNQNTSKGPYEAGNSGFVGAGWPVQFKPTENQSIFQKLINLGAKPQEQNVSMCIDLKGPQFYEFLKKHEIDDQTICLLSSQGIDSLTLLRECTQQSLVAVGLKLIDVIKLKKM